MTQCIACDGRLEREIADWHFKCRACGYEFAALKPAINSEDLHENIDESQRASALQALRYRNFSDILSVLDELSPPAAQPRRLLDVGAAHGWFLEVARRSFDVLGVEPDEAVAEKSRAKGLPVRIGFFPEVIEPAELFHAIAFNDVIEHIPDINAALRACTHHLKKGGVLVLNLPSSSGIFYRLAKCLARLGAPQFFERMWQLGMPSPHVHYFNKKNLTALLRSQGFSLVNSSRLDSITSEGLLERIRYSKNFSPILAYPIYWAILLALPLFRILPADIMLMIFKPEKTADPT